MKVLPKRVLFCVALLASPAVLAQFAQQGPKLVAIDPAKEQGISTALSADGNTAIIGGEAAFVWTRSGGAWSQQGTRLVVNDGIKLIGEFSVAVSADGNTALIGNGSGEGAAWVWTRSGGVWTQQGPKLVGSGGISPSQGTAVALSADGNNAMVSGSNDNHGVGAVWFWTRSGGVWSQQGPKLVGSGVAGSAGLGTSIALSADGNTAIAGGPIDNAGIGAAWVWTRSGGVWTQQGSKLVGSGGVGPSEQGISVDLSDDGNTAIVGGYFDNSFKGAAWVWTRSGSVWTQQGAKLVATGAGGRQGRAVALSGAGDTAIIGDPVGVFGAASIWTRSGSLWTLLVTVVGSDADGEPFQGEAVALSADGKTALVGGVGDNNDHGAVWPFVASTGLSIVKTSNPRGFVEPGQFFGYALAVTNAGPSPAANVTVTDVLPPGLTLFGSPAGSGWTCGQAAGTVTCTAASLPLGVAPTIDISVTAPPAPATLTNVATVSSSSPDPDSTDNTATNVTVAAVTDLAIANTPATVTAFGLNPITYTLTVTNAGPSEAVGVVVKDFLPYGSLFVSASGSGWSCENESFLVVCTRPLLAAGAAPPIVLKAKPGDPPFGITISNFVLVESTTFDPDPENNRATSDIVLLPANQIPTLGGGALALLAAALGALGFIVTRR